MKLKVVVAHDLLLLRDAIASLLSESSNIEIIGESSCNVELIHLCRTAKPDILISYIPHNADKIIPILSEIKTLSKNIKILAITEIEDEKLYLKFYGTGINGIVYSNSSHMLLIEAINMIYRENIFVKIYDNKIELLNLEEKINSIFMRSSRQTLKLTPREKEVLHLIGEGLTTKEISEKLMLSKRTIDYFRGALIQKLHVNSTAGLIRRAIILNSELN